MRLVYISLLMFILAGCATTTTQKTNPPPRHKQFFYTSNVANGNTYTRTSSDVNEANMMEGNGAPMKAPINK